MISLPTLGRRLAACVLLLGLTAGAGAAEDVIVHAAGSSLGGAAGTAGAPQDPALEELVAPVALYPDDLLAVVLPAAAHPLQIVQAARLLDALEQDPSLSPDPEWHDAVVALMNYPEVLERLDADLEWTERLGTAVLEREAEVLDAIAAFRQTAYEAGHLRSDEHQRVSRRNGSIHIEPADPAALYVPDYKPAAVRRPSSTVVYRYHTRPYPVYYYPYPSDHAFTRSHFWGVSSAFRIGWQTRHLDVLLHQHRAHPYYGHHYDRRHYRYRQPWHARYGYVGDGGRHYHPGNRWRGDRHRDNDRPRHEDRPHRDGSDDGGFASLIREARQRADEARSRQIEPTPASERIGRAFPAPEQARDRPGAAARRQPEAARSYRPEARAQREDAGAARGAGPAAQHPRAETSRGFLGRRHDRAAQPR